MVSDEPTLPHSHTVMLSSLTMSPVPLVNRNRYMSVMDFTGDWILRDEVC